jgi:hypothetical protein
MGEENGYSREEVAKFKVDSLGLKVKHDMEMKEVMAGAEGGAPGFKQTGTLGGSAKDLRTSFLGASSNSPQWMQDSLNGKSGVKSSGDLRASRLTSSPPQGAFSPAIAGGSGGVPSPASQISSAPKLSEMLTPGMSRKLVDDEKKSPEQDSSQQVLNSILTSVNQIAQSVNPQQQGSERSQPSSSAPVQGSASVGGGGGVNVSTPVSLTVNSSAGQGVDTATAVAEQIKLGLSSFLSSPEFIGKVTSIANTAAKVKSPPKQTPYDGRPA